MFCISSCHYVIFLWFFVLVKRIVSIYAVRKRP
jgi:hypothetical protein